MKLDTITANDFYNPDNHSINIDNITILTPTEEQNFTLSVLGEGMNADVKQALAESINYTGGEVAYSPIYKYAATYNKSTGSLSFEKTTFNPSIQSSSVAAQLGGVATQVATFNEAFHNMDMFMTRDVNERIMMKNDNKYATTYSQGMLYDDAITRRDNREGWLRPYFSYEEVDLDNGPEVKNMAYGSYFGTNSPIRYIKNGWEGAWGVYLGYNGSRQKYDNTTVYQNGGTLGLVGELYKGNFFTGLTLSTGASAGKADTMFGTDDFTMLHAGLASKSGYNFEFKDGKFIIQPTLLLGYSFVHTFDYTTASGVKMSADPLHSIQLEPGLRFIGNIGNGWRPYANVSFVMNFMDKAKFKANDTALPETSINPYVKYGVGLQKSHNDRVSSFAQIYVTQGGRNGIGAQAGLSVVY